MEQKRFWLLKTEPSDFSWDDMEREFRTCWDGVRNHQAQANLRRTSLNDTAFFYHTGNQRAIVGVVKVVRCFYFLQHLKFGCVDVEFLHALKHVEGIASLIVIMENR